MNNKTGAIVSNFLIIICIILSGSITKDVSTQATRDNYLRAIEKVKSGNFEGALTFINQAVENEPENHEYLAYKG